MTDTNLLRCRSCGAPLTHTFLDLGMSPLANSYVAAGQLDQSESFYPLHVLVCASCFLVQLPVVARPEAIFSDYAYFSSYSDSWLEHARVYVDAITQRLGLNSQSRVVEIASNDGYLLQYFVKKGIPVLGIEPAANVAAEAQRRGIPTEVFFFGEETARRLAEEHGVITLEFPHLMRLMEQNQFDTIYHEHFSYFSLVAAAQLFERRGLKIFDVEELSTHGGSLRVYVCHQEDKEKTVGERVGDLLSREKAAGFMKLEHYRSFEERVKETKRTLLEFLRAARDQGKSVVGYGAPAKGNTLLNYCGVGSDLLQYTVDRAPSKQGQFLPGTHIPIYSPDKIKETRPDYVLILPWNLQTEVMGQMRHIRDWGGQFVVPIPEVRVLP
jgi:hypothetical protein